MVNGKGFENNNGVAHDSWFGLNLVTGMGGYRRREEFLLDGLEAELLIVGNLVMTGGSERT